jgi:hypothetical protein
MTKISDGAPEPDGLVLPTFISLLRIAVTIGHRIDVQKGSDADYAAIFF